ncbi:hypothetical protein RPALISO_180 [Ruegeria phage RpAliso]|nr:hypothetical protein RPALISO_180 [Ruegeria phage RpAliso]
MSDQDKPIRTALSYLKWIDHLTWAFCVAVAAAVIWELIT